MRLTRKEKEILVQLIKSEITTLSEFINEKQSHEMDFKSTKEYIKELENISKKIKGEGWVYLLLGFYLRGVYF